MATTTIIVGYKNRASFLEQSLPSWLHVAHEKEVKQIIIVDWKSSVPLAEHKNQRVRIVRVNTPKADKWHLAACLNVALRHVTTPRVLKLDADYVLAPDFFLKHSLQPQHFFRGNYKIARNENETHLNGALYCFTKDILQVGGYNEHLQGYGYDDTDLFTRLSNHNVSALDFHLDSISHLAHDNDLRTEEDDVQLRVITNMFVAKHFPWTREKFLRGQVDPHKRNRFQISVEENRQCTKLAKQCILNDHHGIPWTLTVGKTDAFVDRLFEKRKRPKFIIRGLNGLGNKWRAMASAGVISEKLDCILIIEWIPDLHCKAEMKDLFDCSELLVTNKPFEQDIEDKQHKQHQSAENFSDTIQDRAKPISPLVEGLEESFPSLALAEEEIDLSSTKKNQDTVLVYQESSTSVDFDQDLKRKLETQRAFHVSSACILNSSYRTFQAEAQWIKRHFRPLSRVKAMIVACEKKFPRLKIAIGIHSRRGQASSVHQYESYQSWTQNQIQKCELARRQSHYMYFIREMKRLRRFHPEQPFFICADRKSTYAAFAKVFPHDPNVFFLERDNYDRTLSELDAAIVDLTLLAQTKLLLGSPWSTFTEMVQRMGTPCQLPGRDFPLGFRGVLMFQSQAGGNIGDNVQAIAASQWFSDDFDYFINRDLKMAERAEYLVNPAKHKELEQLLPLDHVDGDGGESQWRDTFRILLPKPKTFYQLQKQKHLDHPKIKVIYNGWFDGRISAWPPPSFVEPCFISVHINEEKDLFQQSLYHHLEHDTKQSFFDSAVKRDYWKKWSPIGCRDAHTLALFQKHGIPAYLSSCLTLSLQPLLLSSLKATPSEKKRIYVVDADILAPTLFHQLVPKWVKDSALYVSHVQKQTMLNSEKWTKAQELLKTYQAAHYVVTSRLHCALPCLAFGVPVLFLLPNMEHDVRFDATLLQLLGNGHSIPAEWSWETPSLTSTQKKIIQQYRDIHKKTLSAFLQRV